MTPDFPLGQFFSALERGPRTLELDRVVADALLGAGDARGEFVALTLKRHDHAGAMSSLTRKKLTRLFRRLRVEWLGPLAPGVVSDGRYPPVYSHRARHEGGPPEREREDLPFDGYDPDDPQLEIWERGFPVRLGCRLTGTTAGAAEWLTVRELHLVHADGSLPTELAHPSTRHLRRVVASVFVASRAEVASDQQGSAWPGHLRAYLRSIGREVLLDTPSEWQAPTFFL